MTSLENFNGICFVHGDVIGIIWNCLSSHVVDLADSVLFTSQTVESNTGVRIHTQLEVPQQRAPVPPGAGLKGDTEMSKAWTDSPLGRLGLW